MDYYVQLIWNTEIFVQTNLFFSVTVITLVSKLNDSVNEHFPQKNCSNELMYFSVNISANEHFS